MMSDVLVLQHVCKAFGSRRVVDDVSLSVKEGEIFGFLGPNGAGKTTTIKMILGLLSIDSGTILVNGHNIETEFEKAMTYISGIVENPDMYGYLSGYDNLLIQARACNAPRARIEEVVEMVGMQNRIQEKVKSYSLGMRQRLGVAQALLHNPKIMILDEPTNGLDPAGIKEFRDLLRGLARSRGLSVLVSSHILQEMQMLCDTVGIINHGQLLQVSSMQEMIHAHSANAYRYTLRPFEQAVELLRQNIADRVLQTGETTVDLRLDEDNLDTVNRQLMQNGIVILGLQPVGTSLEQSYMEITGGGSVIG